MSCPRCGAGSRPGQKFCAECGQTLATACPSCGAPYEGTPKFCADCGHALAARGTSAAGVATPEAAGQQQTPATASAERRQVSILFADLVGFTAISEQRDPEEVRDLLSTYFETARGVVARYGGTIEKFIGDAVMAVWGATQAQEDDAERAVRAALDLVAAVRTLTVDGVPNLELRAGVLTGDAAVTVGAQGQGMVAGDLVNTASRLQSVAPSGTVLVGETTQRATNRAIAYEPAGEQLLKGKQSPVPAWRALRVVARVGGAGRGESLEPPFVGRDEEFRLVLEQLHAAERQRKLRMISVTGQAGMGKSRLAWELEKHLDGLADTLYYWHQGRSPAYGEGVTFWALGEMVRRRCGIAETDDDATTRDKLRDTLANFVPDVEERRWIEPALGALLGVEQADWGAREQLFSAWRTFFERVADSGPVVLVFEDLQWADDGLLDFIEHTLEWTRDRPMLIVTLARPEMLDRRPNFGLGQRAFVGIHLEPLADEPMVALLRGLVPALAEGDLRRIIERAEGVPLYAVETVRALVDGGHLVRRGDAYELVGEMPGLDVPPTLRALIGSRLDALDTADRALLQDASVVGVVFSVPAVAALSGRSAADVEGRLRALTQRELVALETDARSPERGQYRFLQGLIREVAYGMLSKRDRRTRHLAAAQFFETLGDAELAAILASHYGEAYRAAPDGPAGAAVAAQARVALRAAAERATRLHSHQQAMALTEQALAVTFDEAEQNSLRLAAADSAVNAGVSDKAETYLREAIAWLIKQKNLPAAAMARAQLGGLLLSLSRVDEAVELLASAERELPADAPEAFVNVTGQLARGHMFRGEPDEALGAVDRALEVAERGAMSVASTLQLLITRSWALKLLGRPTEAAALLHGTAELADADGDLSARVRARMNLSSYLVVEDPRAGRRVAEEGVALAEQYGLAGWLDPLAANAAAMSLLIGDLDRVMSLHSAYRDSSGAGTLSVLGAFTAAAAALRGDSTLASQEVATQAAAIAASTSAQDQSAWQLVLLFMALGEGRLADARQHAQRSRDLYAGTDSSVAVVMGTHAAVLMGDADAVGRDLEAWSVLDRGGWIDRARETIQAALLAMEGKVDEAARTYRRVIEEWRAADLRLDLALALLERARLLGSHDAEAAAGRSEARAILEQMGALQLADRLDPPVDGSAAVTAAPRQPKAQPTATPAGGGG